MFLLTRQMATKPGRLPEAIAWAGEVVPEAAARAGLDASASVSVLGRPNGTLTFATVLDSRAHWLAVVAKLQADADYVALLARGAEYTDGPAVDTLRQVLHSKRCDRLIGAPLTQTWTGQISGLDLDAGIEWATSITEYVSDLTGCPLAVLADCYGSFAHLAWVSPHESAEGVDAMNNAMLADAEWRSRVAKGGAVLVDTSVKVALDRTLP
jgi:hypothetical protein